MICEDKYTITHYLYGIIISAPAPLLMVGKLILTCNEIYGYDLCDNLIAHHYKGCMCVTTREKSKLWRKELGIE
jgi:hypothetical protein